MIYRAGSAVVIVAEVRDQLTDGYPLANPSSGVKVTIKNPSGAVVVNESAMTNVSTGVYRYIHQSSAGDPTGLWTGSLKIQDGSTIVLTLDAAMFELV